MKTGACTIGGLTGKNSGTINNVYVKCSINVSGVKYPQWQYTDSIAAENTGTIQREYYNTNLASNKTESEMKASQFVTDLNNGGEKFKSVGNNFPILIWE